MPPQEGTLAGSCRWHSLPRSILAHSGKAGETPAPEPFPRPASGAARLELRVRPSLPPGSRPRGGRRARRYLRACRAFLRRRTGRAMGLMPAARAFSRCCACPRPPCRLPACCAPAAPGSAGPGAGKRWPEAGRGRGGRGSCVPRGRCGERARVGVPGARRVAGPGERGARVFAARGRGRTPLISCAPCGGRERRGDPPRVIPATPEGTERDGSPGLQTPTVLFPRLSPWASGRPLRRGVGRRAAGHQERDPSPWAGPGRR